MITCYCFAVFRTGRFFTCQSDLSRGEGPPTSQPSEVVSCRLVREGYFSCTAPALDFGARFHPDRISGRDRNHRGPDCPAPARGASGSRGRRLSPVCRQPQADRIGGSQLPQRRGFIPPGPVALNGTGIGDAHSPRTMTPTAASPSAPAGASGRLQCYDGGRQRQVHQEHHQPPDVVVAGHQGRRRGHQRRRLLRARAEECCTRCPPP